MIFTDQQQFKDEEKCGQHAAHKHPNTMGEVSLVQ